MIVIVIIKVTGANMSNGQEDSPWLVFWLHIEAAVAVIVVSLSAFRALFVSSGSSHHRRTPYQKGTPSPAATNFGPSSHAPLTSSTQHRQLRGQGSVLSKERDLSFDDPGFRTTHELSRRGMPEPV